MKNNFGLYHYQFMIDARQLIERKHNFTEIDFRNQTFPL
jgi:hypothetical protein